MDNARSRVSTPEPLGQDSGAEGPGFPGENERKKMWVGVWETLKNICVCKSFHLVWPDLAALQVSPAAVLEPRGVGRIV